MKRQIHAYRGHDDIAVEGHNIKLGRGGIREIEFFVQTQQLIAGGRHPELRGRETLPTLAALAEGGWIGAEARDDLEAAYRFLRTIEHRLQMVADEQTHTLPSEREGSNASRALPASRIATHSRKCWSSICARCSATTSGCSRTRSARGRSAGACPFPKDADDRETLDRLGAMGFRKPLEVSATVRRWLTGAYPSLRGEFARGQFTELVPVLLDRLARAENPDAALTAFDLFLGGLQARRAAVLAAPAEPGPGHAGRADARHRAAARRHPGALSARRWTRCSSRRSSARCRTKPSSRPSSPRSLEEARSYEDFLDRLRLFGQEQMFLIGARILSGTVSAEQAGGAFARLADVVVRALHRRVEETVVENHGRIRGQQTALLALGKLGGREMTATSDLDLIIVYDFDPEHPQSDGARPLYGAQYFARLTQRLISALSSQTNYGALYQVDMRLRPSGRSGPVATSLDAFASYQDTEAWTWEHMALTRARVVSGPPAFAARVEEVIRDVLCRKRDPAAIAGDVVEMRQAIAKEKGEDARWDLKYAAGGLIDLEFIAQYLQLVHAAEKPDILDTTTARVLDKAWRLGLLSAEDADVLRPAARLYHNLTQILRLCLSGPFDPKTAGAGLLGLLCARGRPAEFRHARMRISPKRSRRCARASIGFWLQPDHAGTAARFFTLSISEALRT